jgi:hypothetical protein
MRKRSADLARVLTIAILCASSAPLAHAQIGSGWRQDFPSKTIQLRGPGTTYNNSGGIETFTMKSGDERSEMRVQNDYTSGQRQFEGWLRASYGQGTSMHQVFKFVMVVYYPTLGGELRQHSGTPMVNGITGVWVRVNTIHNVATGKCAVYINGTQLATVTQGSGPWYHKYGVYNASTQGAKSEWRDIKIFTYTGATSPTPTPAPTATPGPTSTPAPTATPTPGGGFSGYYRITPRHSGKAVAVQSASTANSADVFQWTYGGSNTNDEWELRGIGSGYYRVINRHSGKDLTVQSASTAEGANIFQYTYGGTATNDEWAIVDVGGGYYRITNRNSGKSAEVAGGSTADGADVVQRTYSGATHQQFQLVAVP